MKQWLTVWQASQTLLSNHNKDRRVFTIYLSIRQQFTCVPDYQMGGTKNCERTPSECRNCKQTGDRVSGCAPPTIFFVQAWRTVVRKSGISANCLFCLQIRDTIWFYEGSSILTAHSVTKMICVLIYIYIYIYKGKVIPLQARCGPEVG